MVLATRSCVRVRLYHRIRTSGSSDGANFASNVTRTHSAKNREKAKKMAHTARDFVDKQCWCPLPVVTKPAFSDKHVTHHTEGHRATMTTVPARILDKIDRVTAVDLPVYVAAMRGFMAEIELLEAALARRVLCDDVLAKAETELAYTSLNLTTLYRGRGLTG